MKIKEDSLLFIGGVAIGWVICVIILVVFTLIKFPNDFKKGGTDEAPLTDAQIYMHRR